MSPFTESEQMALHTVCELSGESSPGGMDTCVINGFEALDRRHLHRFAEICLSVLERTDDEITIRIALHGLKAVHLRDD